MICDLNVAFLVLFKTLDIHSTFLVIRFVLLVVSPFLIFESALLFILILYYLIVKYFTLLCLLPPLVESRKTHFIIHYPFSLHAVSVS